MTSPTRRSLLAGCGYLLVAVAFAWPLPLHLGDKVLGLVSGDLGVYLWNLWLFRHELVVHHHFPFFTFEILSLTPPVDLSLHNYTTFADLLALPLIPLAGVVRSFNLIQLASTAAAGFTMFLLARRVTGKSAESWLAGLLFAASPFLVARSTAHFSLVQAAPLPLFAWCLLLAADTGRLRYAVGAGFAMAWATSSDPYYGVYCLMLAAVWLVVRVVWITRRAPAPRWCVHVVDGALGVVAALILGIWLTGGTQAKVAGVRVGLVTLYTPVLAATCLALLRAYLTFRPRFRLDLAPLDSRFSLKPIASGLGAAGAACLVPLTPMLYTLATRLGNGGTLQRDVYWRSSPRGVDLLAYLAPNPNHPILGASARHLFAERHDAIEQVASLTFVALAVVVAAAWRGRWRPSRLWLVVALFFGALSLGPFLHVGGIDTYVPGPWAFLRYVPLVGAASTPSRFAIVAMMAFAVLFAQALAALRDQAKRPQLWLAAVGIALAAELAPAPRLLFSAAIPDVYRTVAADPRDVAVLQLPFGVRDGTTAMGNFNTAYQFYQTYHEKRLIGGYLSRIPRRQMARQREFPVIDAFMAMSEGRTVPVDRLERARARGPGFARRAGIGYVVIDRARASPEMVTLAIEALRLEKIQSSGTLDLYRPR